MGLVAFNFFIEVRHFCASDVAGNANGAEGTVILVMAMLGVGDKENSVNAAVRPADAGFKGEVLRAVGAQGGSKGGENRASVGWKQRMENFVKINLGVGVKPEEAFNHLRPMAGARLVVYIESTELIGNDIESDHRTGCC
jgi:hypothetical protein